MAKVSLPFLHRQRTTRKRDNPRYPAAMAGQAMRLGVNYTVHAMTH
jgi:hypothetical protein